MKLVLIIGNAAVGKMTVGQELCRITNLRLFHNHITIEPVIEVFGEYNGQAIKRLREVFLEEYAKTENYGLIFTYLWAFDQSSDWEYIDHISKLFTDRNGEVYCVELVTTQEERLKRNQTQNRLKNKPSKRNLTASEKNLLDVDNWWRCESNEGEIPFSNYLKIDNTSLPLEHVAGMIKKHFNLQQF